MAIINGLGWCGHTLQPRFPPYLSSLPSTALKIRPFSLPTKKLSSTLLAMTTSGAVSSKEMPQGLDATTEEEYVSQSNLLQEFSSIPIIDKAWIFGSENGNGSRAMFSISQPNLLSNKKKTSILFSSISNESNHSVNFHWAPFPVEMISVSTVVPSPSGLKMLVVRNQENGSPTRFEIWDQSQLQKEMHISKAVHGSVYTDRWFEGISWNSNETLMAYVAEEPPPPKPVFDGLGYHKGGSTEKNFGNWKGQGDWEDCGETYAGKRRPTLFVLDIVSGDVRGVEGILKSLIVGQVVWAPSHRGLDQYLVFVGWSSNSGTNKDARNLDIKYCYNRPFALPIKKKNMPCALYAVRAPFQESETKGDAAEELASAVNLTQDISSALFPRFSPDGKFLVFLSFQSSVDTGAHSATDSLHRIDWTTNGNPCPSTKIVDVVPIVMCAEDGCFPGLYCSSLLSKPWLSDGHTLILSSFWGSTQVILSVKVLSGNVSRVSPSDSISSWNVLALDGDNMLAVSSSPIDPPQVKYGFPFQKETIENIGWSWLDVSSPMSRSSDKVRSLLSSHQFCIMKIPVRNSSENLTKGAKKPYEAIFVSSSNSQKAGACDPLIVYLHGGPHAVTLTSFSKSLAFLSSLGYSLLMVNYRGSVGFGEVALQSLPGKIGSQDVNDVLAAIDHVVEMRVADPSRVAVLGASHGGFLATHLIGQEPNRFVAAAVRSPVCNLGLMADTSDIPDWCYVGAYGSEGKSLLTEAPSVEHLHHFYNKSPISHISKVKTPTIFLLSAKDLRVPFSNGLQYARALKEKRIDAKVIVFPNDSHAIGRPQSDFECYLNIGVWFKKYLK